MIRILLDEHISPSLVGKLGDKGVLAVAAAHIGLSGEPDAKIWNYAFENDFVVVTSNARDFIRLLNAEIHPGLIVLREGGLTRDEQWDRIRPVINTTKRIAHTAPYFPYFPKVGKTMFFWKIVSSRASRPVS